MVFVAGYLVYEQTFWENVPLRSGIIAGVIVAVVLIVLAVALVCWRRRRARKVKDAPPFEMGWTSKMSYGYATGRGRHRHLRTRTFPKDATAHDRKCARLFMLYSFFNRFFQPFLSAVFFSRFFQPSFPAVFLIHTLNSFSGMNIFTMLPHDINLSTAIKLLNRNKNVSDNCKIETRGGRRGTNRDCTKLLSSETVQYLAQTILHIETT